MSTGDLSSLPEFPDLPLDDLLESGESEAGLASAPPARPEGTAGKLSAKRGTPLSRALLRCRDPAHAPERIELVSRPFMVFGRYNESTGKGFGDFSLGFIPESRKISRLQCAVCATDDGLAAMHASAYGLSFTGLNSQRLIRGCWQRLESKDIIDICGLYQMKVTLGWDLSASAVGMRRESVHAQHFGGLLLESVDLLKQLEKNTDLALKERLKESYLNLIRLQSQAAQLNGVDSAGPLLYARFYREDPGRRRVAHVYLPKRLTLGSSQQVGLRIEARSVAPQHAELLFRDGMYWIHNAVGQGEVRLSGYGLEHDESLPLEAGDTLSIGAAHFSFECY